MKSAHSFKSGAIVTPELGAHSTAQPAIQHSHDFYIVSGSGDRIATMDVIERHGARWIINVWTHHEHRRKGYATMLLHEVVRRYGHEDLYLSVGSYTDRPLSDELLAAWYARFGFRPVANAPGMMRRPADGS